MTPETIFRIQLVLGYVAWLLFFGAYVRPKLRSMSGMDAQRAIATLHSFRFFGLVFILPGVVGTLPSSFTRFAAYGDFVTGLLAIAALMAFRTRPLFTALVVAFNIAGVVDLLVDYYHAIVQGVPFIAGQMASAYWIPILYVPVLMMTHIISFYLLLRPQRAAAPVLAGQATA